MHCMRRGRLTQPRLPVGLPACGRERVSAATDLLLAAPPLTRFAARCCAQTRLRQPSRTIKLDVGAGRLVLADPFRSRESASPLGARRMNACSPDRFSEFSRLPACTRPSESRRANRTAPRVSLESASRNWCPRIPYNVSPKGKLFQRAVLQLPNQIPTLKLLANPTALLILDAQSCKTEQVVAPFLVENVIASVVSLPLPSPWCGRALMERESDRRSTRGGVSTTVTRIGSSISWLPATPSRL
jgi:hypothetical protein